MKQEKYNEVYRNLEKGTINDKTSKAELEAQAETITNIIYDRAYKICREKTDAAYELLGSIKKVITRRTEEMKLTNMDDSRITNKF